MMSCRAGRSVVRLHPNSSRTISSRVSAVLFGVQRVPTARNAKFDLSIPSQDKSIHPAFYLLSNSRGYATRPASRPKAHTGRTTKSTRVRKTKEAGAETDVEVTVKAVKPKAKPKEKTATPKSKAKPKVKAKPKPKPRVRAKPKAKEPVTEKAKAAATALKQRAHIRELRKIALSPPLRKPSTAFTVLCDEVAKETHALPGKEASIKYKNMTTEEHEHYNHIANQNKVANAKAFRTWIESFTPDDIRKANNARNLLSRLGAKGLKNRLQDDRHVKRPTQAQSYFLKDRFSSGDLHGIPVPEATRQIMKEWKELGEADKQKYYSLQSESVARYSREVQSVYRNVDLSATPPAEAAAAAAASA